MEKIISFKRKSRELKAKECNHYHVIIDPDLWNIKCEDCDEKLDPVAFLIDLADKEGRVEYRLDLMQKQMKDLNARNRCKCQHCGKITKIIK